MMYTSKQTRLPVYNTKVNNEEENSHVQKMYHKLGYNKRTTILTSQHMRDCNYSDDYVVGAVIVVDDISFEHKEDAIAFIQNKY